MPYIMSFLEKLCKLWNRENSIWTNKIEIVNQKKRAFLKNETMRNDKDERELLYIKSRMYVFGKRRDEKWTCIFGKGKKRK